MPSSPCATCCSSNIWAGCVVVCQGTYAVWMVEAGSKVQGCPAHAVLQCSSVQAKLTW